MATETFSAHFNSGQTAISGLLDDGFKKTFTLFDFDRPGFSGSLGDGGLDAIDGSYAIGGLSGAVEAFIDFPSIDLGHYNLRYGLDLSVETPGSVSSGQAFNVIVGETVQDGGKVLTGTTMEVDAGSIGLQMDFDMGPSELDIDGFFKVDTFGTIFDGTLIPADINPVVNPSPVEDFVLMEVSPQNTSYSLSDFFDDYGITKAAALFDDIDFAMNLPEAGTKTATAAASGTNNTLGAVEVTAVASNNLVGLESNLLELIDIGPLKSLDLLSEDFDFNALGDTYTFEYTVFGLPITLGLSVAQRMTFSPDAGATTVTVNVDGATTTTTTTQGLGDSFGFIAPDEIDGVLEGEAIVGLGGTLDVQYGLTVSASIGYEALKFSLEKDDEPIIGEIPGISGDIFSTNLGFFTLDGLGGTVEIAPEDLQARFDFSIGTEVEAVSDTLNPFFVDGDKSLGQIVENVILPDQGISYVDGSALIKGDSNAVGWFDSLNFGTGALGGGVFLTSGSAMPARSDTSNGAGRDNAGLDGESRLTSIVEAVFPQAPTANDATFVEFKIDVTDPSVKTVSFDVLFGSEEFPEFVDSYVDIGAVFVNGKNYATFDQDANRPLSVLSENVSDGYFIANTGFPIEFDGVSNRLTILAPVKQGVNKIEVAIADTGDSVYDSGIAFADLRSEEFVGSGTKLVVTPTGNKNEDNVYISGPQNLEEYFDTGDGNDFVDAGLGADVLLMGAGDDEGYGGAGADQLIGGSGNDSMYGGVGKDLFVGGEGAGDDIYDGGSGTDIVTYLSSKNGIKADLKKGIVTGPEIDTDILRGIEDLTGGQGADLILGRQGANVLRGADGHDSISGKNGNDDLFGGNDRDTLAGDKDRDALFGGNGADKLIGGDGADLLIGGRGKDVLSGSRGGDVLIGKTGNDVVTGGQGKDVFVFNKNGDRDVFRDVSLKDDTVFIDQRLVDGLNKGQLAKTAIETKEGMLFKFGKGDSVLLEGLDSKDDLRRVLEIGDISDFG